MPLQPKAIHDEMNATTFDEFGRMQANLGVEAQPPTPGLQNVTLYPFVNPVTEFINGTNLPKNDVLYDANGNAVGDVKVQPMSNATDGTQIWRITHNGVDTHPIHFHLYDVQLLNRVTWDNIIIPPDPEELGWKDTVRMAPLEDTIVALRPIVPEVPWEVPNAIRNLNPMDPAGSTKLLQQHRPAGQPDRGHHQPARQLRLGVRVALPHPEPRRDGHDAAAVAGAAAGRSERPDQHAHQRGRQQPPRGADLERQLDHRDGVPRAAVDQPRQHLDDHRDHLLAAQRHQHPPDADLHRRAPRSTRPRRRATTACSPRTPSATWPTPPSRR